MANFHLLNLTDSEHSYDIVVSDTLGWNLKPTTLTGTVGAGETKETEISVSIETKRAETQTSALTGRTPEDSTRIYPRPV